MLATALFLVKASTETQIDTLCLDFLGVETAACQVNYSFRDAQQLPLACVV